MSTDWEEDGDPWIVKSVRTAYANDWLTLEEHDCINPAGKPAIYGVVRMRRLAVGVLPIEPDGNVHLVGQWRFPLGRYSWEIPEGGAEPGEAAEACARRELEEETGLKAARLHNILEMDLSNSVSDESCVLFLATGLSPGQAKPEEVEVLKQRTAPFQDALARAVDGRIRDSLTVAALLRAHHMAVTGQLPPDLSRAMLGQDVGERHG